jgi:hypothetical protein
MKKLERVITTPIQLANTCTYIGKMQLPELGLQIVVRDYEEVRTLQSNKFMWSALYAPCAEQIGEATGRMLTKDDMHKFFKETFVVREMRVHPLTGEKEFEYKSTTKYKKKEMSDYLEQCFAWGSQHGVWFS